MDGKTREEIYNKVSYKRVRRVLSVFDQYVGRQEGLEGLGRLGSLMKF